MTDIKIELVNNIKKMNKAELENLIYIIDKKHERSPPKIIKKIKKNVIKHISVIY